VKISVEWVIDSLLVTFLIIIVFGVLNITAKIKQAYSYHHYMIAQIEASHFNENVTQQLLSESPYIHQIKDCSISTEDQLYVEEMIYQVTTTYKISLPMIGYTTENTIIGYAR